MNKDQYLKKLVDDFGDKQEYTIEEKNKFFNMIYLLLESDENNKSQEEIIKLIIQNS